MIIEDIKRARQQVVERFGEWTAHNIHLTDNIYTTDQNHPGYEERLIGHGVHLQRIVQIVADITNQPLRSLRVLDLACLEGLYGIEFARHGAEVVGIEGREANIEKARFVKDALSLNNISLVQDDVRNLSAEKYGHFDIVLCLGILYHLDAPDVFHFVEKISDICRRVAFIDTHVAVSADTSYSYKGHEYHGWSFTEHPTEASPEAKLKSTWASLDNVKSFWLTVPSLFNLLSNSNFTSAYECHNPAVPWWPQSHKHTFVAIKGQRVELLSTPAVNSRPDERWPEDNNVGPHPSVQVRTVPQEATTLQGLVGKVRSTARRIMG